MILARHCLVRKCLVVPWEEWPSWVKAPLAETWTSHVSHFGTWHSRNRSQRCNAWRSWHLLCSTGKRKWIHWQWTGQNLIAVRHFICRKEVHSPVHLASTNLFRKAAKGLQGLAGIWVSAAWDSVQDAECRNQCESQRSFHILDFNPENAWKYCKVRVLE